MRELSYVKHSFDVAIVGAGVSGCACALKLSEEGMRVGVYEARTIGSGASGRNAGFALRGCAIPYHLARAQLGSTARELWQRTESAIEQMAKLGDGVFVLNGSVRVAHDVEEANQLQLEFDALRADGFAIEMHATTLFHPTDGAFDPPNWMQALSQHCLKAGVEFFENTRVHDIATLPADHVVIATDGYGRGLLPFIDEHIQPVRNQVLATTPLSVRLFERPHYARWGFDYWRQTDDGSLIVGGCRDVGGEAELTDREGITDVVQTALENLVSELVDTQAQTPYSPVKITKRWSGIFGVTNDKLPLVGRLPNHTNLWITAGYSGQGNVLGFLCGQLIADAIIGKSDEVLDAFDPARK
jgi:gamma-glutamylputrescine oxidase